MEVSIQEFVNMLKMMVSTFRKEKPITLGGWSSTLNVFKPKKRNGKKGKLSLKNNKKKGTQGGGKKSKSQDKRHYCSELGHLQIAGMALVCSLL
ncbi:UNVERIFIED_CONTAM: hypothetical protein Sangu_1190900 [Sesamum angustifolium]|uniref:Gag/pol protein n=1 Tax=Sesamum angustifolium TaxID=2727405 RepID=A0AAW2NGT4_9LAMI